MLRLLLGPGTKSSEVMVNAFEELCKSCIVLLSLLLWRLQSEGVLYGET